MCKIFLAVFSLVLTAPLDGGAAMLIAARASFAIANAKRWRNPYVTDGLIAWWDGVWNAGLGKHATSLTAWMDLVGGDVLTVYGPALSIDGNAVKIVKGGGATYLRSESARYINLLLTKKFTIELVFASPGYTKGEHVGASPISIQAGSARQLVYDIRTGTSNTKGGCLQYRQSGWGSEANRITNVTVDFNNAHTFVFRDNNAQRCEFGLDGAMTAFSRTGSNLATTTSVRLGLNQYDAAVGTANENFVFHGIRIYNRALTLVEVAANHATDRARFYLT